MKKEPKLKNEKLRTNEETPTINLEPERVLDPEIIFENNDYLVSNQPAGLLTHGAAHITEPTLVTWLLKKYPAIKEVGEDPERPGIVHRLDKDVSGLMVIAKNQETFQLLKKQFQNRTIKKEYTALVYGKLPKDEDEIDFPIKRASEGYKMAAVPKNFVAQHDETVRIAITKIAILKKLINYTLIKATIKTGRTHQIRVHLAAYGHPLVGDNLYGTKMTRIKNKKQGWPRIFLVSTRLEFKDQAGEKQKFQVNLPTDLLKFLETAK